MHGGIDTYNGLDTPYRNMNSSNYIYKSFKFTGQSIYFKHFIQFMESGREKKKNACCVRFNINYGGLC